MKIYDRNNLQKFYIASPFFTDEQNQILDTVEGILEELQLNNFSPRRDNALEPGGFHDASKRRMAFETNVNKIDDCTHIIVIPHNKDMGTVFEAGYAYKAYVPIIYYAPFLDPEKPFNLMLAESGLAVLYTEAELREALTDLKNYNFDKNRYYYGGRIE
jgi:nucleoside 2-deoxyribosyltransferase